MYSLTQMALISGVVLKCTAKWIMYQTEMKKEYEVFLLKLKEISSLIVRADQSYQWQLSQVLQEQSCFSEAGRLERTVRTVWKVRETCP